MLNPRGRAARPARQFVAGFPEHGPPTVSAAGDRMLRSESPGPGRLVRLNTFQRNRSPSRPGGWKQCCQPTLQLGILSAWMVLLARLPGSGWPVQRHGLLKANRPCRWSGPRPQNHWLPIPWGFHFPTRLQITVNAFGGTPSKCFPAGVWSGPLNCKLPRIALATLSPLSNPPFGPNGRRCG